MHCKWDASRIVYRGGLGGTFSPYRTPERPPSHICLDLFPSCCTGLYQARELSTMPNGNGKGRARREKGEGNACELVSSLFPYLIQDKGRAEGPHESDKITTSLYFSCEIYGDR